MSPSQPASRTLTLHPGTFRHAPDGDQIALRAGDTLHIVCREGLTPVELLRGLDRAHHAHGGSGRVGAGLVEISGMLLTSLVFLLTLGILDIFGNSLHHVIGEWVHEEGANHDDAIREGRLLLLSTLLFFGGMVAVRLFRRLPLFEENLESVGHTVRLVVEDFLNSKRRQRRRLRQRLKRLGADQVARIEVWNPQSAPGATGNAGHGAAPTEPLAWSILLPALVDVSRPDCALALHIRQDETADVCAAAQALPDLAVEVEVAAQAAPAAAAAGAAPRSLIPAAEQTWLPLLALAAFDPAALTPLAPAGAARVFSENAFHRLLPLAGNGVTRAEASRFLNRCLNDYGLLRDDPDSGLWFLAGDADAPPARQGALWTALFHALTANAQAFVDGDDPLTHLVVSGALCALLHDLPPASAGTRRRLAQQLLEVVGGFIAAVEKSERYDLMKRVLAGPGRRNLQDLGRYLPRVVDAGEERGDADAAFTLDLAETARFNAFGYDTLARLARLFEVVGAYPEAIAIWTKLAPLDPTRARVRLARLEERSGDPQAAARAIDPLLAELDAAADAGGEVLAVPPLLRAEAYLEGAWIIYSVLDDARRDEGRQRLATARRWLLASPPDAAAANAVAIAYWRYHNYLALYLDWAGDYAAALAEHRRALAIPGVSGKWYSGTLSNIAYVARKAALAAANDAPAARRHRLDDAVTAAGLAADLKERLGDEDELPVALHNLAVSRYCRAALDEAGAARDERLSAAAAAAREGLAWLDKADSDKKRGALLLETLLAGRAAGADADPAALAALLALPDSALAPAERRARDLLAAAPDEAARGTALDELGRRVHCLELLA